MLGEKFDYSKGVIRSRQFNDQKREQNTTQKAKDQATRTPTKPGMNSGAPSFKLVLFPC